MKAPAFALILGIAFALVGILGFVPFVTQPAGLTAEYIQLNAYYGFVFGLFPVNVLHDAVHLLFGIWGILASLRFAASVAFARTVTWIYGIIVILGLIPITGTLFGAMPIYGHDIWLHAIIVLVAAYAGYGAASLEPPPDLEFS
jgi:hypothetical protein